MNTEEIEQALRRCGEFDGVFAADDLPDRPRLLVVNTDPAHRPGRHWVCIYVGDDRRGEYFDSLGQPPTADFESYLNRHCFFLDVQQETITERDQQLLWTLLYILLYASM